MFLCIMGNPEVKIRDVWANNLEEVRFFNREGL